MAEKKCPECKGAMIKGRKGYWCRKLDCRGFRSLTKKDEKELERRGDYMYN